MPIRISTIISFTLIMGIVMFWGVLFKKSFDEFSFWRRGTTAIVLPIDQYEKTSRQNGSKVQDYYVADLNVRVKTGEIVTLPGKPVTLQQIQESHQRELGIVFLPGNPQTNRFAEESPGLLRLLLLCGAISLASFIWFRVIGRSDP